MKRKLVFTAILVSLFIVSAACGDFLGQIFPSGSKGAKTGETVVEAPPAEAPANEPGTFQPAEGQPAAEQPAAEQPAEQAPSNDPMQACADGISLPGEPAYPLIFCDNFDDPATSMMTGFTDESKYMKMTGDLYKGAMTVRMDVKRLSTAWIDVPVTNARDFIMQVDGRLASHSGHPYHKWGIMFKKNPDADEYYYFAVDNNKFYYFMLVRNDKVTNLINGRRTEDLKPLDKGNTLTVVADGDTYSFYINGVFQEDYKDNRLLSGNLGLYFIVDENTILDWEFDNLVVYAD